MKTRFSAILTILIIFTLGCSDSSNVTEKPETTVTPVVEGTDYLITIKTDFGEMKAILYDETPQHKANFLKLVGEGFYDGLLFHRVIKGFMVQGGDPDSRNSEPGARLGAGGPGYTVPAEFVKELIHVKGALSAARQPDQVNPQKASSGSQFYIVQGKVTPRAQLEGTDQRKVFQAFQTLMQTMPESELAKEYQAFLDQNPGNQQGMKDLVFSSKDRLSAATGINFQMPEDRIEAYSTVGGTPFLDDQYTVFGRVIAGLEIIDQIAAVKTLPGDRPEKDLSMNISVVEMSRTDIVEQYGNPYIN